MVQGGCSWCVFGGEGLHGLASFALGRGEGWGRLGEPQAKTQSSHPDCFCLQPSQVSWRCLSLLCLYLGQAVLAESCWWLGALSDLSTSLDSCHTEYQTRRVLFEFGLQRLKNEAEAPAPFRPSPRVWVAPLRPSPSERDICLSACLPAASRPFCPSCPTCFLSDPTFTYPEKPGSGFSTAKVTASLASMPVCLSALCPSPRWPPGTYQ